MRFAAPSRFAHRRFAAAAVAALTLLALAGCGADSPNLDSPGKTIVCFGDSITAGVGAGDAPPYPQLLGERLGLEIINAGVPGETTGQALRRLDQVLALDPWLVIVELGGNDILQQVPIERTEANLRQIVERLLQARVAALLVEIHGPFFGGRFGKMFGRLHTEYRVPVVRDALNDILSEPGLRSDNVHPNAAGYRALAEAVAQRVEPLLRAREKLR